MSNLPDAGVLHGGGAVGCHFPELKVARALAR
jgi:hypothetical protein